MEFLSTKLLGGLQAAGNCGVAVLNTLPIVGESVEDQMELKWWAGRLYDRESGTVKWVRRSVHAWLKPLAATSEAGKRRCRHSSETAEANSRLEK